MLQERGRGGTGGWDAPSTACAQHAAGLSAARGGRGGGANTFPCIMRWGLWPKRTPIAAGGPLHYLQACPPTSASSRCRATAASCSAPRSWRRPCELAGTAPLCCVRGCGMCAAPAACCCAAAGGSAPPRWSCRFWLELQGLVANERHGRLDVAHLLAPPLTGLQALRAAPGAHCVGGRHAQHGQGKQGRAGEGGRAGGGVTIV